MNTRVPLPPVPVDLLEHLKPLTPLAPFLKYIPAPAKLRGLRRPGVEQRVLAYGRLQRAVIEAQTLIMFLESYLPIYSGPTGLFYQPHLMRTVDELRAALARVLGALLEVRMVGSDEVRAASEQLAARIDGLVAALPRGKNKREQRRQQNAFTQAANDLGMALRDLTPIIRRDLGYDRKLRRRWWQLWRPRSAPAFPGGWPVPQPSLEGAAPRPSLAAGSAGGQHLAKADAEDAGDLR